MFQEGDSESDTETFVDATIINIVKKKLQNVTIATGMYISKIFLLSFSLKRSNPGTPFKTNLRKISSLSLKSKMSYIINEVNSAFFLHFSNKSSIS